jgi:hypothetical protein
MTSEWPFNSQVPSNTFQKNHLVVRFGLDVRASLYAVTAVTASCEVRYYIVVIAEIVSQTGSHPW